MHIAHMGFVRHTSNFVSSVILLLSFPGTNFCSAFPVLGAGNESRTSPLSEVTPHRRSLVVVLFVSEHVTILTSPDVL